MGRSGDDAMARYRTIAEPRILDSLVLHAFRDETRFGDAPAARRRAAAVLEDLIGLGLKFDSTPTGDRLFDPVEVANFICRTGLAGTHDFWRTHCVVSGRALVWEAGDSADGFAAPPGGIDRGPGRYRVKLSRAFNMSAQAATGRMRLRLPLPIQDDALTDLTVAFTPPADLAGTFHQAVGYLEARLDLPAPAEVTLAVDLTFTARGVGPVQGTVRQCDEADVALYTRPSEGLIHVSPRVTALAQALADGETDPARLVRRFQDHLLNDFVFGSVHYDLVDPASPLDWALDHRAFDCQFGSALMASLCRASGIPARVVTGYPLYVGTSSFHTWLEVWLEETGWTPFDLAAWDLSAGGLEPAWREVFSGRVDPRMVVERPPRLFTGPGGLRLPKAWHLLRAIEGGGTRYAFHDLATGDLVYSEYVEVIRLD